MDNSMNLFDWQKDLILLIQWADPIDGCDIICRMGEWKYQRTYAADWYDMSRIARAGKWETI